MWSLHYSSVFFFFPQAGGISFSSLKCPLLYHMGCSIDVFTKTSAWVCQLYVTIESHFVSISCLKIQLLLRWRLLILHLGFILLFFSIEIWWSGKSFSANTFCQFLTSICSSAFRFFVLVVKKVASYCVEVACAKFWKGIGWSHLWLRSGLHETWVLVDCQLDPSIDHLVFPKLKLAVSYEVFERKFEP